jgi:hypothetical protein
MWIENFEGSGSAIAQAHDLIAVDFIRDIRMIDGSA